MAAPVVALIAFAAAGTSTGGLPVEPCSRTEAALQRDLESVQWRMEPEGPLLRIYEQATEATERCPAAEGLAYVLLRSAELGRGELAGLVPERGPPELPALASRAAERFPRSARILTVQARATGNVDVARRAVAADPTYVPGRVALADILVQSGDWRGAEEILAHTQRLNATDDGLVVWARVNLEKGDPRGALAKAMQALTGRRADPIEPGAGDPRPEARAHAIAAKAALALHRFDVAANHLLSANPDEPLVRDLLRQPPPELAKALRARRARQKRGKSE